MANGPRRRGAALILMLALTCVLAAGCGMGRLEEPVHRMGELTAVGPVIYNVLETQWLGQLGFGATQALPNRRFLVVRLTMTNSGNSQVAIPLLSLEDAQGNSYMELSEVSGVAGWLGLLRVLEPAATLTGTIVFDVPSSDYTLRVTDGGDLESEKTALIEIPLTLESAPMAEAPGSGAGF